MPPPHVPYPPLPDPGPPFDLAGIGETGTETGPRRRWWRRSARQRSAPTIAPEKPLVLLAIVPEVLQCETIRHALGAAGLAVGLPPRITLQTGLDAREVERWRAPVSEVVRRCEPFTVRLVGPDVIDDRTVCLRVVGPTMARLGDALHAALGGKALVPDEPRTSLGPVLPLAGTWTGFNRVQLHELATAVRNEIGPPIEFRATSLYAFEEFASDDLPFLEFPLGRR